MLGVKKKRQSLRLIQNTVVGEQIVLVGAGWRGDAINNEGLAIFSRHVTIKYSSDS